MRDDLCHAHHGPSTQVTSRLVCLAVLLLVLTSVTRGGAADNVSSNTHPLSSDPGQRIINLRNDVWEPLKGEEVPPGLQIAMLRGDLAAAGSELLVRLPANYTLPHHSRTSDEIYVWIQGDFTYLAEDGTTTPLSRHAYISLPTNVPHALRCGNTPCVFYVRDLRPFDYMIHRMPTRKS
jgi:quercetin dioxygenase-like cupin family protein